MRADDLCVRSDPHAVANDRFLAVCCCADTGQAANRAVCSDPAAAYADRPEVPNVETWTDVGRQLESYAVRHPGAAAEQVVDRPANWQQWPKVVTAPRAQQPAAQTVGEQRLQARTVRKQPPHCPVLLIDVSAATDVGDEGGRHEGWAPTSGTMVSARRNCGHLPAHEVHRVDCSRCRTSAILRGPRS